MPKVFFLAFALAFPASAQLPADTSAALSSMAARAGVMFTGRVLSVTPTQGVVEIAFEVETPIKGVSARHPYILREWAGLWSSPTPRYLPGEHLLLLLTARSPHGISSPVDGYAGIIPIIETTPQPSPGTPDNTLPTDPVADLRWLQTSLPRTSTDLYTVGRISIMDAASRNA